MALRERRVRPGLPGQRLLPRNRQRPARLKAFVELKDPPLCQEAMLLHRLFGDYPRFYWAPSAAVRGRCAHVQVPQSTRL
jgi:hypothetical protein